MTQLTKPDISTSPFSARAWMQLMKSKTWFALSPTNSAASVYRRWWCPVIEYHFLRNDSKEYQRNKSQYDTKPVPVSLLSASRKICNMIFSLNFYQKEPVGGNREAASCQVYSADSNGRKISDTPTIIADKTIDNVQKCRSAFSAAPSI